MADKGLSPTGTLISYIFGNRSQAIVSEFSIELCHPKTAQFQKTYILQRKNGEKTLERF